MGINLGKGQTISLKKPENNSTENDLSKLTLGLGWDINDNGQDYDLDAVALLLNKEGKLESNDDVICYSNKQHKSEKIHLTGDNLTGAGAGDDEQIIVNLNTLNEKYDKIVFYTTIFNGHSRQQEFSKVQNAYIRAVDAKNNEIAKFSISGNSDMKGKRSFVFAEAYRHEGEWKFRAIGEMHDTDSLMKVAETYKSGAKKLFGIFG